MFKKHYICMFFTILFTSSLTIQTVASANSVTNAAPISERSSVQSLDGNCKFGDQQHVSYYTSTPPDGWVVTWNRRYKTPSYGGETDFMCIQGASYGNTALTVTLSTLPQGWFVVGYNTHDDGLGRYVIKYLLGATSGATERVTRDRNQFNALPAGWEISENNPSSSTVLIRYVGSSTDYGKTLEIPYSSPVPENYVVIADKGSTKIIKFIPVSYSPPFSVEQVLLSSPVPRG